MFAQYNWESQDGPWRATDVRAITGAYKNDNLHLYAANRGSTLIKSTNYGTSWFHINQIASPLVVACKSIDPDIVVAGKDSLIAVSTNGGILWNSAIVEASLIPLRLEFAPASAQPNRVFLGTKFVSNTSSLRKSTDAGAFWYEDPFFKIDVNTNLTSILFNPRNSNRIWVGGSQISSITQNSKGELVTTYIEGEENSEEQEAVTRGVWRSTNGGSGWSSIQLGGKNITAMAISIDPDRDPATDTVLVFAGTSTPAEIRVAKNISSTWIKKSFPTTQFNINEIRDIKIHPDDPDYIFVATDKGVFFSDDIGETWYKSNKGLYDTDVKTIALDPNDSYVLFAGTPTSIFLHESQADSAETWYAVNTGIDLLNTSALNILNDGIIAGSREISAACVNDDFTNQMLQKNNRTLPAWMLQQTWYNNQVRANGGRFETNAFARQESGSGYTFVCGAINSNPRGSVYRNSDPTDPETPWDSLYAFPADNTLIKTITTDQKNESVVYAAGFGSTAGNFLKSTNDGSTWNVSAIMNSSQAVNVLAIDSSENEPSSKIIYAGLESGGVWKSTNSGTDWSQFGLSGERIFSIAFNPTIPNIIYAGGSNGLWRTTNNGNSWSQIRTDTVKKILMHPITLNTSANLFVLSHSTGSNSDKIFEGAEYGTIWRDITGNLPSEISDFSIDSDNPEYLYTATQEGIYKIPLAPPPAPSIVSPGNNDTLSTSSLIFQWNAPFGAGYYSFQLDDDENFSSPVLIDSTEIFEKSITVQPLLQDKYFYWRVKANNDVYEGDWSSAYLFHIYPLVANISGPEVLSNSQAGTFTAEVEYGSGNLSFSWYRKDLGSEIWVFRGTQQTQVETMYTSNFELKCVIDDILTGLRKETSKAIRLPVILYIAGADSLESLQTENFTANVQNSSGNVSYQWYRKDDGQTNWTMRGTQQTQAETMLTSNFTIKCDVHDNVLNVDVSASKYVVRYYPAPTVPQNLVVYKKKISVGGYVFFSPLLNWNRSQGPFIGYKVYKRLEVNENFSLVTATTDTFYLDTSVEMTDSGTGNSNVYYYVTAYNNNTESAQSNIVGVGCLNCPTIELKPNLSYSDLPTLYELSGNYPNPFNPVTQIRYSLPENCYVSLKIFDMLGRHVATLLNGYQDAGYKSVEFNAAGLTSGIYFCRFQTGKFVFVKKMLLAK